VDAAKVLAERISLLDKPRSDRLAWAAVNDYCESRCQHPRLTPAQLATSRTENCPPADIAYVITVLDDAPAVAAGDPGAPFNLIEPAEADERIAACRILKRIGDSAPEIATSPVRLDRQYWVGTAAPEHLPAANQRFSRSSFTEVSASADEPSHVKPFYVGLFSCTDFLGTCGMWRMYLDLNRGSSLFPEPWYTWKLELESNPVVREISSATDWVEFTDPYLRAGKKDLRYPDWARIAQDYDGIHLTLPAVTAIDGLPFRCGKGILAPSFWGVESTFWLRWRFVGQSLHEVAG
jgi:hypothetical protein